MNDITTKCPEQSNTNSSTDTAIVSIPVNVFETLKGIVDQALYEARTNYKDWKDEDTKQWCTDVEQVHSYLFPDT